jgi:hypothetical protein
MSVSQQPRPDETTVRASAATTAVGVFEGHEPAAKAIRALKAAGFSDGQIGVASREWSKHFDDVGIQQQQAAGDGAVTGAAVGAGLGATLGLVGGILIPGLLPVVAGQALVSALLGGAAGAAGGAFAGPFIAMGLADHEATLHARHVEEGKTVLLVHAPGRKDDAHAIMVEHGAYDASMNTGP